MDSDSDSYYITTYSEDERIEASLKKMRKKEQEEAKRVELNRKALFEEFYDERGSMFRRPGLTFLKFTSSKIKFTFHPCKLVRLVRERVIFYCTLIRRKKRWSLKRDTFPNKITIYNLFYAQTVTDANVLVIIMEIYTVLTKWAQKEHQRKKNKIKRYRRGEDVYLHSEDEELFLTDDEIKEHRRKKNAILARMIPPSEK